MRTNRNKYPLRKIVDGKVTIGTLDYELLECGHAGCAFVVVNNDMYGTKSANSRRCRKCYEAQNSK